MYNDEALIYFFLLGKPTKEKKGDKSAVVQNETSTIFHKIGGKKRSDFFY